MEEAKFTWLPKFTATLLSVPEEHQLVLFRALARYGTYGVEPELDDWGLRVAFEALREDIDNNKSFRGFGRAGGRGNRKAGNDESPQPDEGFADADTPLPTDETGVSGSENGGLGDEKGGFGKSPSIPNHTNPNHTNPDQSNPDQAKAVREVVEYLNAKTGKRFRAASKANATPIRARLADGYTVGDLKAVIDAKVPEWLGKVASDGRDMTQYLCPETLFRSRNIERYLNQKGATDGDEYSRL